MENTNTQHRALGLLVVFGSVLALMAIRNPDKNTAHIEDHAKAVAAR